MTIGRDWLVLQKTGSTQSEAASLLQTGGCPDVIFAHRQTNGRGRFGRPWLSGGDDSLTFTLVFKDYADHPKPWLIGMATALVVAQTVDCQVQWPNDLRVDGKKVGGVLTELLVDREGRRIPVAGIGMNLKEGRHHASLPEAGALPAPWQPLPLAHAIVEGIAGMPLPESFDSLRGAWQIRDGTQGKLFRSPTGEELTALGVDDDGRLVGRIGDKQAVFYAADALFGQST